jgi:hypothetical protein
MLRVPDAGCGTERLKGDLAGQNARRELVTLAEALLLNELPQLWNVLRGRYVAAGTSAVVAG